MIECAVLLFCSSFCSRRYPGSSSLGVEAALNFRAARFCKNRRPVRPAAWPLGGGRKVKSICRRHYDGPTTGRSQRRVKIARSIFGPPPVGGFGPTGCLSNPSSSRIDSCLKSVFVRNRQPTGAAGTPIENLLGKWRRAGPAEHYRLISEKCEWLAIRVRPEPSPS